MLVKEVYFLIQDFAVLFILCEHGQLFSNAFIEIEDRFDQFDWYLMPIEVRQILPIAILYVQQPIEVKFFGSFSWNRERSKWVSTPIIYRTKVPQCTLKYYDYALFSDDQERMVMVYDSS